MVRTLVAALLVLAPTSCGFGGPRADDVGHGAAVDDALATVMADYQQTGGGAAMDRQRCDEFLEWSAVTAVADALGLDKPAEMGSIEISVRRREVTRLGCSFAPHQFDLDNGTATQQVIHVTLLTKPPAAAAGFSEADTHEGRRVLTGQVDLYDLGGWGGGDVDTTVHAAVSTGDSHTLLVAVRTQVADGAMR